MNNSNSAEVGRYKSSFDVMKFFFFFSFRDGSTMQHRSSATNASFMLAPRGGSTRLVRQTTRNSNLTLNLNRGSQTPDETLLAHLLQEESLRNNNEKSNNDRQSRVILRYNGNGNIGHVDNKIIGDNHV